MPSTTTSAPVSGRRRAPVPSTRRERRWWAEGAVVAGIDEVGRGAWAGPLAVGAVALSPTRRVLGVRDSKALPADTRAQLAARLAEHALATAVGRVDVEELDRIGLAAALRLAAARAVAGLALTPDVVLIDGSVDLLADGPARTELVVSGDALVTSIAAASIVAKVARDEELVAADTDHPAYGFARNKGYPTPDHRQALAAHGPCALHRSSFAPIAALRQPRLFDLG